jgi:hypothetical protein
MQKVMYAQYFTDICNWLINGWDLCLSVSGGFSDSRATAEADSWNQLSASLLSFINKLNSIFRNPFAA